MEKIKVFISYTDDVKNEMASLKSLCERLNKSYFSNKGIWLECIEWRTDVPKVLTGQRTQDIINKSFNDYQIYFGILWKHFGVASENGLTPVEEEFERALYGIDLPRNPLTVFFFRNDNTGAKELHKEQLDNIDNFRKKVREGNIGLYGDYESEIDFIVKANAVILDIFEKNLLQYPQGKIRKNKYEFTEAYLARKVCYIEDFNEKEFQYLVNYSSVDLADALKKVKRISLVNDAGFGKTFELKRTAKYFSEIEYGLNPFFVSLSTYTNENIEDLLPVNYRNTPQEQLLIILDGLDEIPSESKQNAIRKIERFIISHPQTSCIISSRTNFYRPESKTLSGTLADFKTYVLLELTFTQIEQYLTKELNEKKSDFTELLFKNNLEDLLKIPFYLIHLVKLYKENSNLPDSKATILEELIKKRVIIDKEKFRNTYDYNYSDKQVLLALQKVSVAMELLGRNFIEVDEMKKVIKKEKLINDLEHLSIFIKKGERYEFEHNNYREYLAAITFSNLSFEYIKRYFAFSPDFKTIVPSRVNTLSFLFSILQVGSDKFRDLTNWVFNNDLEKLISIERDRIDEKKRSEIFIKIYNDYRTKKIFINRDKFNYKKLSIFGQSDRSIEFLLDEIEKSEKLPILNNAIELLGDMKISSVSHMKKAKKILMNIILNKKSGLKYSALRTLADLKLNSKETINEILSKFRNTEIDILRAGIYFILQNSDYNNDYVDIYLEGIQFMRFGEKFTKHGNESVSRIGDEFIYLTNGLEKINSAEAWIKIFTYFINNPNDLRDIHFHNFDSIVSNLISAYNEDESIFHYALDHCKILNKKHLQNELSHFLTFIKKIDKQFDAFKILFKEKEDIFTWSLLVKLSNNQVIEYVIDEYKQGRVSDNDVWYFKNNLGSHDENLSNKFEIEINRISNNKFLVNTQVRDYVKDRKEAFNKFIGMLFNRDSFVSTIKEYLNIIEKNNVKDEDIRDIERENWEEEKPIDYVLTEIRRAIGKSTVSKNKLIQYFESRNWQEYVISNLYSYMSNGWEVNLSEEQKKDIQDWCIEKLKTLDYRTALHSEGTTWNAVYVWFFLREFNFIYPNDVLLDLLSFDWFDSHNWIGTEYLESMLTENQIKTRILENFKFGEHRDRVVFNFLKYSRKVKLQEVMVYLEDILINSLYSNETRKLALTICMELIYSLDKLLQIVPKINDNFKWEMMNEIVGSHRIDAKQILKKIFVDSDELDKLRATFFLLKYQDMEALKFYVDTVKSKKSVPHLIWNLPDYGIPNLNVIESLPYLIDLLKVTYQKDFIDNDIYSLNSAILNTLFNISVEKPEKNFPQVKEELVKFIKENSDINSNINFIHTIIERMEEKIATIKTESLEINEVIKELDSIFVE